MTSAFRAWALAGLGLAIAAVVVPALVPAADRSAKTSPPSAAETVDLFTAIEKGQVDVKLVPKDSTQCRVMIENKTKQPLSVKLPAAFAAVPVLGQLGGVGGGVGGGGGQMMGGGMGGMGGGMGGGGMGMFNIPPEKVGQFKVPTVCLEHGKPDPRPAMKYQIKPLEQATDVKQVHEVCRMLGEGRVPQRAAQVAAWHLNNNMSMEELAAKQLRFADGRTAPYFSAQEIQAGMQVVATAAEMVKQQEKVDKSDSLSQR